MVAARGHTREIGTNPVALPDRVAGHALLLKQGQALFGLARERRRRAPIGGRRPQEPDQDRNREDFRRPHLCRSVLDGIAASSSNVVVSSIRQSLGLIVAHRWWRLHGRCWLHFAGQKMHCSNTPWPSIASRISRTVMVSAGRASE